MANALGIILASIESTRPILIDGLTGTAAPGLAIAGARDLDQAPSSAVGTSRRVHDHFYRVADLERIFVHALRRELSRSRTLDRPSLHRRIRIRRLDVKK